MAERTGLPNLQGGVTDAGSPARVADLSPYFGRIAESARQVQRSLEPEVRRQAEERAREDVRAGTYRRGRFMLRAADEAYTNAAAAGYAADLQSDMLIRLEDLREANVGNVEGFAAAADEALSGFLSEAPPEFGRAIEGQWQTLTGQAQRSIAAAERERSAAESESALNATLGGLEMRIAGIASGGLDSLESPEAQRLISEYRDVLDTMAANPLFSLSQEEADLQAASLESRMVAEAAVTETARIYEDVGYEAAVEYARTVYNDESLNMTAQQREQYRDRATSEASRLETLRNARLADIERRDRIARRVIADREDDMARIADTMLFEGDLSSEWLIENRESFSPEDYRRYLDRLQFPNEPTTNPTIYSDLVVRASRGEDVRNLARRHYTDGSIDRSSFNTVVNMSADATGDVFRSGADLIEGYFRQSEFGAFDTDREARKVEALSDYASWLRENPEASFEEAEAAARRYAGRHGSMQAMTARLPAPRYGLGRPVSAQEIDQAEDAAIAAFDAGEIDREALVEELRNLERWREAFDTAQEE